MTPFTHARVTALAAAACLSLVGGCASTPADLGAMKTPPRDFTLDLTVFPAAAQSPGQAERPLPARYIIEPGGALRAAAGPGVNARTYPPEARLLDAAEVERLWRLVVETGLTESGPPAQINSPLDFLPRADSASALVGIAGAGRRDFYRVALGGTSPESLATGRLITRLGDLAYLEGSPLP